MGGGQRQGLGGRLPDAYGCACVPCEGSSGGVEVRDGEVECPSIPCRGAGDVGPHPHLLLLAVPARTKKSQPMPREERIPPGGLDSPSHRRLPVPPTAPASTPVRRAVLVVAEEGVDGRGLEHKARSRRVDQLPHAHRAVRRAR